jgi:outer membrane protein assembly factor BamB
VSEALAKQVFAALAPDARGLPPRGHPFKWGMPRGALRIAIERVALLFAVGLPMTAHAGPNRASAHPAELARDIAWSFHAGTPLSAPPTIAADGSVLVVTVEGYLHALRADGGYRYSYTLRGRAVGSPVSTPDGLTVAAVEPNRLIAIDADGGLAWSTTVVGGVATPPIVDERGRIWVGTRGRTLLGFSARGAVSAFARVGPAPLVGPVALSGGEVALASTDGSIRLAGGGRSSASEASPDAIRGLFLGDGSLFALGEGGLVRFETGTFAERWRRAGVERVLCARPALVVLEGGVLRFLSVRGEPGPTIPFPAPADAPAACRPDGEILVTKEPRSLLHVRATGVTARRTIPAGDVLSVHAVASAAALIAYRGGRVVALR